MGKPVAVLGGGNGGHCMAADLALAGHEVHLYELPEFAGRVEAVLHTKEIRLTGIGRQGVARLALATTDMAEAIRDVDLINVVVPAFGHRRFFEEMLPHLRSGQTIVLWAADFGSLEARHFFSLHAPEVAVNIVEANTLPYGTRMMGPGWVHLLLPSTIYDRYITEDLPYGLVPVSQLARKAGLTTPVIDAVVTLGCAVCGKDFWREGRTLEKLGLEDYGRDEIVRLVREGR